MQPELLNQLKIEIHNKCVAYDYNDATDNTLSDFIINLIQVNKTAQEVNEELLLLVGSDYDSNLTQWIFERKTELENSLNESVEQTQQTQQLENTEQPSNTERDVVMDDNSKVVKPDRENRMFSKAIGSVIGHVSRNERSSQYRRNDRSRTRSRSPTRPSVRNEKDRYTSRHEYRRSDRKEEEHSGTNSILSRLGSSNKSSGSEAERPSVFDRLGNSKPIPSVQNNHDTKKERCKYWPNCKNGEECIYFHPTTVCPDFPNCPKSAIECMFIHPEVTKPVMQQVKKLPIPCKFFPYCSNPHCPFVHPVPPQPFFMQTNPSFVVTGHRVQIPCKNADACTRPDCHFLHPKDHNPPSEVICKFDGACTRPNCFYKHTKTNDFSKTFKKPDINTRQFSVAEEEVVERIPVGNSADMIVNQHESSHINTDEDVVMDTN